MSDCTFCDKIALRQYDKTQFTLVVSFEPLNPVVPGHRLFVPVHHSDDPSMDPRLFGLTAEAAARYVYQEGIDANIISSVGEPATQTIFHTHVHVIPRSVGDGLTLPWS